MGSARAYVPKHLAGAAAPPPRPRWPLPVLAAGLLAGIGGLVVLTPGGGPDTRSTDTTLAADAGEIAVCTRASLEDRAALTLVVGLPGVTDATDPLVDQLAGSGVGGVMLRDENILDEEQAVELVEGLRARLGEQLLVAIDDEGGRVTAMGALDQPVHSARTLGQLGTDETREFAHEMGELARSIGVDWVFAPVVDLDDGPAQDVIGDRSFGTDPGEVSAAATAFASGLRAEGLAITAKHFPGHGRSGGDPHLGVSVDDSTLDDLQAADLLPFRALIDDGAEAVMVGHVAYPAIWGDEPASLVPGVYELLREQGFTGVAITDALGMGAVHARYGFEVAPAMALAAGADAVLVNQGDQVEVLHHGVVDAVDDGRLDEARLDEAVGRVLQLRGQPSEGIVCPSA
ncbi:MAG TPA: glycoside hydrolase family 3 N-terminal domain-containing protein [Ornithinibacter sp.]|nr:glycoside hydrolase family 3 N-terminal domain-containing protein [Ornithinibacter sp.]